MYCPNCKQEYDGKFCPECGTKLIDAPQSARISINLGDANAISGGININTNNITNIVQEKTLNELYSAGYKCYHSGAYEGAVEYFSKAADKGHLQAMYYMGYCYYWGYGTAQSYEKAFEWFYEAANRGDHYSQYMLGLCFAKGHGVEQSSNDAVKWWRLSAKSGNCDAQCDLGNCYRDGFGVEQSYEFAFMWTEKAANCGSDKALYNLGWHYFTGNGVALSYEKALEFFEKSARIGDDRAMYSLAWCYYYGKGVKQSYEKAVQLYKEAAYDYEHTDAKYGLALCYYNGQGVEQSYEKAVQLLCETVEMEDADGMDTLGVCYYKGTGVKQSYEKALVYFKKAIEGGCLTAKCHLGMCYYDGCGVEQSYEKALDLFNEAMASDITEAYYCVGKCYYYGNGVEQSYERAAILLQTAIDKCFDFDEDRTAAELLLARANVVLNPQKEVEGQFSQTSEYDSSEILVIPAGVKDITRTDVKDKSIKQVVIPSSVEEIDDYAFEKCRKLESVLFEDGSLLQVIGNGAFKGCSRLKSITIPSSVEKIGDLAFMDCNRLESVVFDGDSVLIEIGCHTFADCYSLRSITLPLSVEGRKIYSPNQIYVADYNSAVIKLIRYKTSEEERDSIVIPEGVTEIKSKAFIYYPIKKLFLPSTLKILKLGSMVDDIYLFSSELQSLNIDDYCSPKNLYVLPQYLDRYIAQRDAEGISERELIINPMPDEYLYYYENE